MTRRSARIMLLWATLAAWLITAPAALAQAAGATPIGPLAEVLPGPAPEVSERSVPLGRPAGDGLGATRRGHGTQAAEPVGSDGTADSTGGGSMLDAALGTVGPLAAVVGLMLGAAWLMRTIARSRPGVLSALGAGGRAPSGVVDVMARYPIARGQTLALIRIGARVLIVSQSHGRGGSMQTLSEVTDAEEVAGLVRRCREATGQSLNAAFESALTRMTHGQGQSPEHPTTSNQPAPSAPSAPTVRPIAPGRAAAREVRVEPSGDRVELLRAPAMAARPGASVSAAAAAAPIRSLAPRPADPVAALRARLEAMKSQEAAA